MLRQLAGARQSQVAWTQPNLLTNVKTQRKDGGYHSTSFVQPLHPSKPHMPWPHAQPLSGQSYVLQA